MTICQELKCKKQEAKDLPDTLCKFHYEKLEKSQDWQNFGVNAYPNVMKFKTTNENNNVWENGCEHVRSIPTNEVKRWIKNSMQRKNAILEAIKILNEDLEKIEEKILDQQKTLNSRYTK